MALKRITLNHAQTVTLELPDDGDAGGGADEYDGLYGDGGAAQARASRPVWVHFVSDCYIGVDVQMQVAADAGTPTN